MKGIIHILISLIFLFHLGQLKSQSGTYELDKFEVKKIGVFNPKAIIPAYNAKVQNLEAPTPGGTSYRSALLRMKKEAGKRTPRKSRTLKSRSGQLEEAIILDGFAMKRLGKYPVNGELQDTLLYISGGIPLDNTLAISNDNYLMCGINTKLYMHNLNLGYEPNDSNIMVISFADFAPGTQSPFDPKLLYDPDNDRFIATFLTGRAPSNSGLVLAFSTSNDPTDEWNVYRVSGNPLDNNTWSDYPAMAMTEDELFYTVNLLVPGGDWKLTFSSTVIWQFDKESGFSGDSILKTNLWSDIAMDGRNLRNLAPVQGGDSLQGPNMYFLSNRNFDLSNDSIFIVEVTGKMDDPDATMGVSVVKADQPYGLPPNGRQENSNPNDTTDGFDTNDSRVLGSFKVGDEIQFVGNTMDFQTGYAAVYHGIISNISGSPSIQAITIGDNTLDFGYPNIVYSSTDGCEPSSLIAFDHTSPTDYSGVSMMKYSNGEYSPLTVLKEGEGYVDSWLAGSYERWGDYFGIQRKYNEPGVIWTAGFYGLSKNSSATWISEIRDCQCFDASVTEVQVSDINSCIGFLDANVVQGIEPYSYNWNTTSSSDTALQVNLCDYKYSLIVSDDKECNVTLSGKTNKNLPNEDNVIYPNPAQEEVNVVFTLGEPGTIEVIIYSVEGKVVSTVVDSQTASSGKNMLTFSTSPLSAGTYILIINSNGNEVYSEKLIVL